MIENRRDATSSAVLEIQTYPVCFSSILSIHTLHLDFTDGPGRSIVIGYIKLNQSYAATALRAKRTWC